MGAQQSNARTLTVENDDPTLVIKVSEAVADRLKGKLREQLNQNESQSKSEAPVAKSAPPSVLPPPPQHNKVVYYSHPGMSSLQYQREKEEQLRDNDQYWQARIQNLERGHMKMNNALEKEYESAITEIKQTFANEPSKYQLPPCREAGSKLMKCYQSNPGAPLECSSVVREFSHCVDAHRVKSLTAAKAS